MGPAASLAREKGDSMGSRAEGEGCSLWGGVGRLKEMSDVQRELTGPSGGYNSQHHGLLLSLECDRIGGWQCRQNARPGIGRPGSSVCLPHHLAGLGVPLFPYVAGLTLNVVVLEVEVWRGGLDKVMRWSSMLGLKPF